MTEYKTCKNCCIAKPVKEYYKCRKKYHSDCKSCFKSKSNKNYVKVSDRPGYQPKKVGRKTIVLTKEQRDIINSHDGPLIQLAFKLNITYDRIKYWRRVGKF